MLVYKNKEFNSQQNLYLNFQNQSWKKVVPV